MKTFLLELRDAAKVQRDPKTRQDLRNAADALSVAIDSFAAFPSAGTLQLVNGLWAHAYRLNKYQPVDDPSGGKGLKESAALAA